MRLDRIVESGLKVDATHAHDFIREGKVSVHAQEAQRVVTHPRFQVILGLEEVHVSGKPIALPFNKTLIMNKPKQCISERVRGTESWCRSRGISFGSEEHSLSLEKGNPKVRKEIEKGLCTTVYDILPKELDHHTLGVCGRLDKDTTGLFIMTTDGGLQQLLSHPDSLCIKKYIATLDPARPLCKDVADKFKQGLQIKGGKRHKHCQPSEISILNENGTEAEVAITEGFYHQVKRMIHSCGSRVLLLKRSQIGNLQLDPSLKEGQVREMSTKELVLLCKDFDLETRELLANSYN
eukprot:m.118601 g.118601  ORF g.118601 m.118601 type:complete len:294 (+) comp9345_c0_seq2:1523-2404(+)